MRRRAADRDAAPAGEGRRAPRTREALGSRPTSITRGLPPRAAGRGQAEGGRKPAG